MPSSRRNQFPLLGTPAAQYRMCSRCIMDTSDPEIEFDATGVCNHCDRYSMVMANDATHGHEGRSALEAIAERIRAEGKRKQYDCIIGLSGGVDSTYVAYLARQLGLRPLAIHLDNGWNSETAARNIENVVSRLGIDLQTKVLDWAEFRDLQVAFLRASTPDCEIPTDHAIAAVLYRAAIANGVRYIVSGTNFATELMMPRSWSFGHFDWRYISSVAARHGQRPLRQFPHYTAFERDVSFPFWHRLREVAPLNFVAYSKQAIAEVIEREVGWRDYGSKHHESIYTRFQQTWILPRKFGIDKRRAHLSCLVNSGQLSREQAIRDIANPAVEPRQLDIDRRFVLKKLGLSDSEFAAIETAPIRSFWDYDSYEARRPFWWESLTWRAERMLGETSGVASSRFPGERRVAAAPSRS